MSHSRYHKPSTISEATSNPRYHGKIVIESPEGLYSTTKEDIAVRTYRRLRAKYSSKTVVTTIIPKGILLPTQFRLS